MIEKMDELSIDSKANKRIKRATSPGAADKRQQRGHFRIDWRQLTYYQKIDSYSGRFVNKFKSSPDQQQSPGKNDVDKNRPKRILNSLDGCFKSGQLSAILGPSGAGKSTFLSTLFGSKQDSAYGQTKVTWLNEEQNLIKTVKRRPLKTAFLPQHDHLLHHLTVYETLIFASKIKNATRMDKGKNFHHQNVKRVAKMLKLTDCLDTRCKKLSGGQYKRVSIGQELLSEPDVIILDEPTSGLDAMTCLTTVMTLKSIVMRHPMSIILTIHQPDIDVFNLFDHIYAIAQGGRAIYEGSPHNLVPTLAEIGLKMPNDTYNPARFIVENAFLSTDNRAHYEIGGGFDDDEFSALSNISDDSDSDDDQKAKNYIKRSVLSLTEVIGGKELVGKKDKKPLLNIGVQTLDGKLITSNELEQRKQDELVRKMTSERLELINKLNERQKARYNNDNLSDLIYRKEKSSDNNNRDEQKLKDSTNQPHQGMTSRQSMYDDIEKSSAKSDYSSAGWSDKKGEQDAMTVNLALSSKTKNDNNGKTAGATGRAASLAQLKQDFLHNNNLGKNFLNCSLQIITTSPISGDSSAAASSSASPSSMPGEVIHEEIEEYATDDLANSGVASPALSSNDETFSMTTTTSTLTGRRRVKVKRQFDKCLSAKFNNSRTNQKDYPIWYHSFVLTHRTWLSIIRDPIFFGIQACMHTTIPILLALIFGSIQEEGCPRVGSFDLVEFAYSDSSEESMIQGTVKSIRQSIGNIGIVFFEMFVLSFSINCITALVFPLDMYVLLKEYRNGWYSLRSYFIGRTLADLPVPIFLHSLGMSILFYLTGQPLTPCRFMGIIVLVILSSLVAQSVGLTIGALLMKSSQSAVLAAAGIVAPFFALSGFIVRIYTLPFVAQLAAKGSYLYHLLNGFIIMRYGFGRCQCKEEDFEANSAHQIPKNIQTLASMWVGTYSNEYPSVQMDLANKTNVDPNIDVVEKMMTAFKMANSYGHQINSCQDVLPYAMLDFNLKDSDIYSCFMVIIVMLVISRLITFAAIYHKVRSSS